MAERAFVWLGGGIFIASLGVCAFAFLFAWGRGGPYDAAAVAPDAVLLTAFALHHSVFARASVKQRLRTIIPDRLERPLYVWVASVLLILVCVFWRPIGGELYEVGGAARVALAVAELLGVWLIARAVAGLDALELAGIRRHNRQESLQRGGVYRLVRHPLYLGWTLVVFATPHMTGDRFAFAVLTSVYLAAAVPFEERSLVQTFGDDYARYRSTVRWRIVPFIY
jgi:protein-S-isoprenylcysteine O-methyltransferase Ste14